MLEKEKTRERELPSRPEDFSVELLNDLIREQNPDLILSDFTVTETHLVGDGQASSAGRIVLKPVYQNGSVSDAPKSIVAKVARIYGEDPRERSTGPIYANEVNIYTRLQPHTFLETPAALGGAYDPATTTQLLLLEDLRDRGVVFANVTVPTSLHRMRSLLDQLAILHARYWESPEFDSTLNWTEQHTKGAIYHMFNAPEIVPASVTYLVGSEQFRREMVERLGVSVDELLDQMQRVQKHQATLSQTICHGDTHIANTYILPDDRGGLLDWQLASRGYCTHDLSYLLATGLSVKERRTHERELLDYYRGRLIANGVTNPPTQDELWTEYSRAMVWCVYIGWLLTPVVNYGWEITVINHLRVMTAYEDLETARLVNELG